MSMQSALLGYLVSLTFSRPITIQENVVLQTTAVLAAGFVGIIPALGLLDYERDHAHPIRVGLTDGILWGCAVALFGVFLAPPLRRQMIVKEELVFPSGTATAQLIAVLHEKPDDVEDTERAGGYGSDSRITRRRGYEALPTEDSIAATQTSQAPDIAGSEDTDVEHGLYQHDILHSWRILGTSFAASSLLTLSSYFFPVIFNIPLFGVYLAREWLWYFTPSLSYVGQGIIMGFPTTLSMSLVQIVDFGAGDGLWLGCAFAYIQTKRLGPWANWGYDYWSSRLDFMGFSGMLIDFPGFQSIICADSFVSITPTLYRIFKSAYMILVSKRAASVGEEVPEDEPESRLVPDKWVWAGLAASVLVGTILVWVVFGYEGIKPWATVLGFLIGGVLSHLGQLLFAVLQPGNVVANIIAGGVAEAGAQQAGDLMQDLKTGHLLHASPRAQFYGQLVGSVVSIFVSAVAYNLYTRVYAIPGPQFPAPTAYVWLSFARLIGSGNALPNHTKPFIVNAAITTALVATFKMRASSQGRWWAKWIPSGVAFAIGFLNTPSFTIARLLGGIAELLYRRRVRRLRAEGRPANDVAIVVLASGFVLGEGVVSIVGLVMKSFGMRIAEVTKWS
ncbi:hypothetical protein FRC10_010731 [Ceratobasidium sp. 414]|nr:hypothetical protein FRC10_010731 [Ceratobasidium sp. 414]